MNLYKIIFKHYSPKDSESGVKCFLLAENDVQVFNWVANKPEIQKTTLFNSWKSYKSHYNQFVLSADPNFIDEETEDDESYIYKYLEILKNKGEIDIDYMDYSDAYYGITNYGWELIQENIIEYDQLELTGLLYHAKN